MAEIIRMPKLSDTMTEGVVAKWHKKIGEQVKQGELLAEIETDKATMEFESYYDGTILYHGVEEGKASEVDTVLAIVGKKGEDFSQLLKDAQNGQSSSKDEVIKGGKVEPKSESSSEAKKPAVQAPDVKASIIKMPKLSDTMTEGVVAKWHKKVGDKVDSGQILAEIETDKATMEFESYESGTLLYIGVEEGQSAKVDSVLAVVGEKEANFKALVDHYNANFEVHTEEIKPSTPASSTTAVVEKVSKPVVQDHSSGRIKASPLAKKLAEEKGISLNAIKGSGDGGRIVKRDVEQYGQGGGSFVGPQVESFNDKPVSQMRKTIARRLAESKFSAPHFYLTINLDMDQAIEARRAINNQIEGKISFNDMVIKAAAMALKKHPQVNVSWLGDTIRSYGHVHVGVAVAVEEGLVVPVIRHADAKSFTQIGADVKSYADKARNKTLQPADYEGSTFTVSNLGMFGIDEFTAIINPPNACILAVGAIQMVPVVRNGEIVTGNVMKVTLSCDHRAVDGAKGAEFLSTFRNYIENPITMFI